MRLFYLHFFCTCMHNPYSLQLPGSENKMAEEEHKAEQKETVPGQSFHSKQNEPSISPNTTTNSNTDDLDALLDGK